jgi:hypothetical protein
MELFTNYMEWKKEAGDYAAKYEKLFSKYGINPYAMEKRVLVIEKKEIFEKRGRKCYPAKATETKYTVLPFGNYLNTITGVLFFHDRVTRCYDRFGYIPYTMTCSNPDNTKKIRRTFQYIGLDKLSKIAGNREKDAMWRLDKITYDTESGCMEFYATPEEDGHADTFKYDVKNNKIVG